MLPECLRIVARRGVRIVTPAARALAVPVLGPMLRAIEWRLCDSPLAAFGGFWIAALKKS